MSAVSGLLAIKDASTNEWVGEFQQTIFVRNSRGYNVGTTLFGLMARLDNEPADAVEYNWFERDPATKTVYTNAGNVLVGSTTLTFDDGAGNAVNHLLEKGMVLMNDRTREFIQISSAVTASGSTVDVTRGFGGTAAALTDNDTWTIVTLGKNEGEAPIRAMYEQASTKTNYIQTFNSTVELTNAFKNSVLRTDIEGPLTDRRIQALERIGRDIEFAYLLGVKKKTVVGNGWELYTGGIYDSLVQAGLRNSNILFGQGPALAPALQGIVEAGSPSGTSDPAGDPPAGCKLADFNAWLSNILPYGSDAKLAFCGPAAYQAMSTFANSATNGYRIMQNEQVFGMNIQVINTPFGELSLAQHPLMREAVGLRDWMFVIDLGHMTQKVYEKLFLEPNIQTPGSDSYKEQYRAKLGLKLKFANAFGVAHNLSLIIP